MSVIKVGSVDRGYKKCECHICKSVSICTPHNDFYTTEKHGDNLLCESCFRKYVREEIGRSNNVDRVRALIPPMGRLNK